MGESESAAAAVADKGGANFLTVLRRRDFRLFWVGQLVSQMGDSFYWLALLITVNDLTGSTAAMGITSIALALPILLFGPVAGVFVDRWDRRWTMIVSDLLRAGLVLFCILVREPGQIWIYWVVGFLMSTAGVFFSPAKNAVIPLLVGEEELLPANALSQTTQTLALIAGSAAAGFAIGLWGARAAFAADSASFLLSALVLLVIHIPRVAEESSGGLSALAGQFREGLSFIAHSRTVLTLLAVVGIFQLGMGAVNVLWVPFLDRYFGVGPQGIGIVDSSQGVGMLIGGALVGNLASRFSYKGLVGGGMLILGLGIVALALAPSFGFILVLNAIFGLALTPMLSGLYTLLQKVVPNVKLGRVSAALAALTQLASVVSMGTAGWLGDQVGIRPIFIFCGSLGALAGIIGFRYLEEPRSS